MVQLKKKSSGSGLQSRLFIVLKRLISMKSLTGLVKIFCTMFLLAVAGESVGQSTGFIVVPVTVFQGDTIPYIHLPEVEVFGYPVFSSNSEQRQYDRLVRNVRRVYPYARLAGELYKEYEQKLKTISSEKEKRKIIRDLEEQLHQQYGDELRQLTFSQGVILIKLIDRQTGETSYDIVKELRGVVRAFFYQSFARLFGLNLKLKYDPDGEDRRIETIVRMIEQGVL